MLRFYNWKQIGMLIDSDQCGTYVLPFIKAALNNATDINVADTVYVDGTNSQQIEAGFLRLQQSARSMCSCFSAFASRIQIPRNLIGFALAISFIYDEAELYPNSFECDIKDGHLFGFYCLHKAISFI